MTMTRIFRSGALALLALVAAAPARAQDADPRWFAWIGCWQTADEESPRDLLCVRPAGGGVEVSEIADGVVRSTQTLVADGRAYPFTLEGCAGTRTAEFSADGHRIFTLTEQACDGDVSRSSTGLIAMVSPQEWVDVQAAQEDGRGLGWARRYRAADPRAVADAGFTDLAADRQTAARRARTAAAAPVDVDDVIEAVRAVDPEGVRTWIASLRDPFDLDRNRLLRLADAGVPASVIDVMVAVSYPERFALDRDGDVERLGPRVAAAPGRASYGGRRRGFFGPVYWDPFYSYGAGYGYGYGYGYGSPYGGYYVPGVVIVEPREDEDPAPNARVVKGRGYTRGTGGSGNSAPSGSSTRDGGSQPSPAPAAQPSSEPSSEAGSGSEERRAKPRGG